MYLYLMAAVPRATDKYAKAALPKTPMKVEWSRGTKDYKMAVHMLRGVVYGCYLPFTRTQVYIHKSKTMWMWCVGLILITVRNEKFGKKK